jgi:hypothetical protein
MTPEQVEAALLDGWEWLQAVEHGQPPPKDASLVIDALQTALAEQVGWTQPE